MFSILLCLIIFVVFFLVGYLSLKRSGGFFLMLAGFCLLNVGVQAFTVLGMVGGIIVLFSLFIVLTGAVKAFYRNPAQDESGGRMQVKS